MEKKRKIYGEGGDTLCVENSRLKNDLQWVLILCTFSCVQQIILIVLVQVPELRDKKKARHQSPILYRFTVLIKFL